MPEEQEAKPAVSDLREITIQLDVYDDIFSDFDPRPYQERELSDDFLKEIQRRYLEDKRGRFEVHFTIPSTERDTREEALIKRRLREHFAFMVKQEDDVIWSTRKKGYMYVAIGAFVLIGDVVSFVLLNDSVSYKLLSVMLVPAGWYGMFTGIGKVIDEPFEATDRKKLYEKFEKANYVFMSEEME